MQARSTKGKDKVIMEAGFAARRYGRVTLERDSADTKAGENPSVSYAVNPYTCRVSEGSVPSE
jgi:hypothetical protein